MYAHKKGFVDHHEPQPELFFIECATIGHKLILVGMKADTVTVTYTDRVYCNENNLTSYPPQEGYLFSTPIAELAATMQTLTSLS